MSTNLDMNINSQTLNFFIAMITSLQFKLFCFITFMSKQPLASRNRSKIIVAGLNHNKFLSLLIPKIGEVIN